MSDTRVSRVLTVVCWWLVAIPCVSQVSFEWGTGFGERGLPSGARCFAWHDFGNGPELCAGADFDTTCQILRFDGHAWQPLGPILDGTVIDLISFDAGSGPVLFASAGSTSSASSFTGIFRWTGSQWVSQGIGADTGRLAVFDFGSGPRLCTFKGGIRAWDGTTWTLVPNSASAQLPTTGGALAGFDDGSGPRLHMSAYAFGSTMVYQWTGTTWLTIGACNNVISALEVWDDGSGPKLYAGGSFTQMNGIPAAAVARWNGASWSAVGPGFTALNPPGTANVSELLAVQGTTPRLYAAGTFSNAGPALVRNFAAWNGGTWTPLASTFQTDDGAAPIGTCLAVSGPPDAHTLYVGGRFNLIDTTVAHNVASRPGGIPSWSSVPSTANGSPTQPITASTIFDSGNGPELVVAGNFSSIGGAVANRIARFDGTDWHPLASGIDGNVTCLASWNDGASTALYAAGWFSMAGGVPCQNIAKWDGFAWSPLGSGLTLGAVPTVSALLPAGTGFPVPWLIAAGTFAAAGGNAAFGIAGWNGSYWSTVGNGDLIQYAGGATSLCLFDDGTGSKLYAGGNAGSINGIQVNGLQRFDGFGWSTVPGWNAPLGAAVRSLGVFDDGLGARLYVAWGNGTLTKLDGVGGAALVTQANGPIYGIRAFDDGDGPGLYLGGQFTNVGGVSARGVARYRTGALAALGQGLSFTPTVVTGTPLIGSAKVLEVYDDGSGPALFVGGSFSTAGSTASSAIARWGAGVPVLALSQTGGAGSPTFVHCSNLQAGREYYNIVSTQSCGGGLGPYLGLCASDPATLLIQLTIPLETPPLHFLGLGTTRDFGPYDLPAGLSIEAITIDLTGGALWRASAVASITFQ